MSATDNAFIKIYKHKADAKTPRPNIAGGTRVDRRGITVSNSNVKVSQVVASAGTHAMSPETAAAPSRPLLSPNLARVDAPHPDRIQRDSPADGDPPDTADRLWRHESHAKIPTPHVDVARFESDMTVQGTAPQPDLTGPQFRPAWEVDRFRWPEICDELQRDWAAPLTGIVRSIVRQAWRGGNVVSVTQFGRFEGATTLALCLARIAAAFHIRVAIVDGNAQNPDVGPLLGLQYEGGWETTGLDRPLEEAAIGSLDDRLIVLPLGATEQPTAMDDPAARRCLLERLANSFELVVLDAGPVFVAAHRWFSQPCVGKIGSALIVRDVRRTDGAQLDDVCCRLRGAGIANMSVVENFQFA